MLNTIRVADATRLPLDNDSVDLVMGSPPYMKARDYGITDRAGRKVALRDPDQWSDWMINVSLEALRVSRGLVLWVVSGETKQGEYQPGPEGLIWKWYERGYSQLRPCYWLKNGLFGSGGPYWFRNRIEYVIAFKAKGILPYAHPTAMGKPPKYGAGGDPTYRNQDGTRVRVADSRVGNPSNRKQDGTRDVKRYHPPRVCNPGNLVKANVGKGHMGDDLAHENEAPYPERLPHWFISTHCPPSGAVCDPFCGSGTTLAVAKKLGRSYVGFDIRQSQVELSERRLAALGKQT